MRGLDIGDAANDGAFAGDIERGGPQDYLRSRQRFRRDVCHHDAMVLSGQKRRGGCANAAAAAGDENDTFSGHGRCPYPV